MYRSHVYEQKINTHSKYTFLLPSSEGWLMPATEAPPTVNMRTLALMQVGRQQRLLLPSVGSRLPSVGSRRQLRLAGNSGQPAPANLRHLVRV